MISLNSFSGDVIWKGVKIGQLSSSEALVLQWLMNNPGELVSKEKLLEVGWPDKFVQQNSLNVAIKKIRTVLTYITDEQIIETRHRKGYVFHKSAISKDSIRNDIMISEPSINRETIPPAIRNSILHKYITSDIGKLITNVIFICSFTIVTLWSIFIASLEKPIVCYKFKKSNLCGYSPLNLDEKNNLQQYIDNTEGTYLYGYDKELEQLKIYKMD
ncbi:winged helix-turn-helix domain-containing protein [Aeromonas veronii]|uniref:winged helix-turn-helix domain-containing protein n=1 Tax=Aeromonas veronii TaxID=654 RepID=UPI003D1C8351